MKYCFIILIWSVWLVISEAASEADKIDASWVVSEETNCTVITSKQLDFDSLSRKAVFEGDVVVKDAEFNVKSNRLTVFFTKDNKVNVIEAEGEVVIEIKQDNEKIICSGKKSVYDVKEGKFVITGSPMVHRKADQLSGKVITFWRDTGRVKCEIGAEFRLYSNRELKKGSLKKE